MKIHGIFREQMKKTMKGKDANDVNIIEKFRVLLRNWQQKWQTANTHLYLIEHRNVNSPIEFEIRISCF